jgi:hypothetical protein
MLANCSSLMLNAAVAKEKAFPVCLVLGALASTRIAASSKLFFGQKDVYRDATPHLDAEALHNFARQAPRAALCDVQLVGDESRA